MTKKLLAAILIAIFLPGLAAAQVDLSKGPIHQLINKTSTPTPAARPASAPAIDPFAKLMQDIANIKQEVISGTIADLAAADKDAATVDATTNLMRDPIAHACYPALSQFLQTLPTAQPLEGKFIAVQLHQRARDFALQVKAGLPTYLKLGCAPLIGDDLQIIVQGLGLVGVTVASGVLTGGIGPLALPLPLPAL